MRVKIAVILIIFSISLPILSLLSTNNISHGIVEYCKEMQNYIVDENFDKAQEISETLNDEWEENYKILSSYIGHDHLERLEISIASLKTHVNLENFEMSYIILDEIIVCAYHLLISQTPSFYNIF